MAITKIIKVKVNTKACIDYITNPKKTENELLTTYNGCSKDNAPAYFQLAQENKNQHTAGISKLKVGISKQDVCKSEILAYHIIQSFAPTDPVTPEKAHELGLKFMKETFGGKYAFVCATHVDKGHIHNHFCLCSAERGLSGKKLNDNLALLHQIQNNSDKLCREYGLSVIEKKKGKTKSYAEWLADKNAPTGSKKQQLRNIIDKTIIESASFEDYLDKLKEQNIIIEQGNSQKYGTVTKYKLPDDKRFTRGYSLGSFYSDINIQKRIERHLNYIQKEEKRQALKQQKAAEKKAAYKAAKQAAYDALSAGDKRLEKSKLKISSMKDSNGQEISLNSIGLQKWTNRQNAMRMQQISEELSQKYGISYTQIRGTINSLKADKNKLDLDVSKKKKELVELKDFIEQCMIYKRFKIYDTNLKKSENPEEYYQKNDLKIDAFEDARFNLEHRGIDLNSISTEAIKVLQKRLEMEELELKNLENQQKQNEREQKELADYQKEIEIYFGRKNTEI